jgi:diaminopropionate ammonia-lyase
MSSNTFVNKAQPFLQDLPPPNPAVRNFHKSLPHYAPTPLVSLPEIAKELGIRHLVLKNETSRFGLPAFKILGASWGTAQAVLKRLGIRQDTTSAPTTSQDLAEKLKAEDLTLYAATDGNHGRAVARMAKYLGVKARIFVPAMLDDYLKGNIAGEGAEVVVCDGDYDQAVLATKAAAENHADGKGLLISDTALVLGDQTAQWIVDGYQTMFDEIDEQIGVITSERITHILSPVGVGSLSHAVVTHFGSLKRESRTEVITVEPTEAACLKASLEAGEMTSIDVGYSICSGMCCGTPSATAWPVLRDGVSMAVSVEDVDVEKALLDLKKYGVHAGPCGAATTAAVRQLPNLGRDAVVVLLCTEGTRPYEMKVMQAALE